MVQVFEELGNKGFDGNDALLQGVPYHSSFEWERLPAYYLGDYFRFRRQENLPLNEHEQALYDFLKSYSVHLNGPSKPTSDLPVESSVVFRPERVQAMAARLANLDLESALEWYQCAGPEYVTNYWPRESMLAHLKKVVGLWRDAASHGEAVLHTEF